MPTCRAGCAAVLAQHGHDAMHTLDLPARNATKDGVINQLSFDEQRVVVSKDTDFFYSHLLHGRPWKLLLVKTGNISTRELRATLDDYPRVPPKSIEPARRIVDRAARLSKHV